MTALATYNWTAADKRNWAWVDPPPPRTMRQFAEAEIVIPSGPFAGKRFHTDRQPFTRLWFDAVDSGLWHRFVATGPSQSGKTLAAFVIPVLYNLFELGQTVIIGLPDMDMAADKWTVDFLPVILRTKYAKLLPESGGGSRGGKFVSVQFRNGALLRFMSGGGRDKARAGFTAPVVAITETDGLDEAGGTSREADKISQLEARSRAYIASGRNRCFMECTVSIPEGRTWREYEAGTQSRIILPCPHCRAWVSPEREHLVGWNGAENVVAARDHGMFCCPACGAQWTEQQRIEANHQCRLIHRGQKVDADGNIAGPLPPTDTFAMRWSGANNLLVTTADLAADEWKASREPDEENATKRLQQFVWAMPYRAPKTDLSQLDALTISRRMIDEPRGHVPADCRRITVGIDLGKYLCHWLAIGWRPNATPHVIDYGRIEVATADLGEDRALLAALRGFRDSIILPGWPAAGGQRKPDMVAVDAGWHPEIVDLFAAESGIGFIAAKGFGAGQQNLSTPVKGASRRVLLAGDHYSAIQLETMQGRLLEVDADHWKGWLHARLATPVGQPGGLTFFRGEQHQHLAIAKHFTAERRVEEFVAGRGLVSKWEELHRNNHWLDAAMLASVAGHGIGERLIGDEKPVEEAKPAQASETVGSVRDFVKSQQGKW